MKNAVLLPLRYLIRLILCIAASLLIIYCAKQGQGISPTQAFGHALRGSVDYLPFLVLLSLMFVSFVPVRRAGNLPLSFLFLFLVSVGILFFGCWELDRLALSLGAIQKAPASKPYIGMVERSSDGNAWYVQGIEDGNQARGLVKADFSSLGDTLSFGATATMPKIELDTSNALPIGIGSMITDAASINAFARSGGTRWLDRLIASAVLAFFFCSLWVFPRLTSWPLLGALFMILAFRLALLFSAMVFSATFAQMASNYVTQQIYRWLPHAAIGIFGAILIVLDVVASSARGRHEGRSA
jgi:hypothetical protein